MVVYNPIKLHDNRLKIVYCVLQFTDKQTNSMQRPLHYLLDGGNKYLTTKSIIILTLI